MLCLIFIIPLMIPGLAQKTEPTEKKQTCNQPDFHDAGDQLFSCFNVIVQNKIKKQNATCNVPLNNAITNFIAIANKTCYKDIHAFDNFYFFEKLWFYSLKGYKNFVERKGVECVNQIKKQVKECVSGETGAKDLGDKYEILWKKNKVAPTQMPCGETPKIKECTLKAMRNEKKCRLEREKIFDIDSNENVLYVSSLFDYMLEICHHEEKNWKTQAPAKQEETTPVPSVSYTDVIVKDARTTHVLLAVLLTLAIAGMLYVLFRECRGTKTGNWKSINENFEMGRRRRSLVNNEVCQSGTPPPASCK